jgi:hypothetical protein
LDAVRSLAGEIYEYFLIGRIAYTPSTTDSNIFAALLLHKISSENFTWMKPGNVFPLVSSMLESDIYFPAVLNGLIISIGGLSETLSKDAATSVIDFVSHRQKLSRGKMCSQSETSMMAVFKQALDLHSKLDRIFQPLMNTFCFVLKNELCDPTNRSVYEVLLYFLHFFETELRSCVNIARIREIASILNEYLRYFGAVRTISYCTLLSMLGHKYPKIRKCTVI